jgi:hypothetical protein
MSALSTVVGVVPAVAITLRQVAISPSSVPRAKASRRSWPQRDWNRWMRS